MTLYTSEKVADILDLNRQTILRYIRQGKLKAVKVGKGYRIKKEDLEEFINEKYNV